MSNTRLDNMTTWTSDELNKIGVAEELKIASLRSDGTLRKPTIIWVVRVGDDLYVRSVNGRTSAWFRGVQTKYEGHIRAVAWTKMSLLSKRRTPASMTRLTLHTQPSIVVMPASRVP